MHDDSHMSDELCLEPGNETEAPSSETVGGGKRSTLSRVIPTSRLTFQKQVEIIRAYGAAYDALKGPVGIEDITGYVKMAAATVSQTNAFLTDAGVVRKEGRRFVPAPEVQAMNRLYDVSKDKALTKLAPLFEKAWFGAWVMPKLRFRPMAEEEVVHELFEAATAEATHLPQIRMLVDYLVLVGLVDRDGALLRVKNGSCEEPTTEGASAGKPQAPGVILAQTASEMPEAVLLLSPDGKRRFIVKAPPTITAAELARIRNWLEFQLIVEKGEGEKLVP
jgi:hypothetical protein